MTVKSGPRDKTPEALAAWLEPRLSPWLDRGLAVVRDRIEDARAHADKALTQSLIGTPDGRRSWAKVQTSPSYLAALNRLDEILIAVAGPTKRSLSGIASDLRAKSLAEGFGYWPRSVPVELLVSPDPEPTTAQIAWARGLVIFDQDDRTAIVGPVEAAKRSLSQAVLGSAMQNTRTSDRKATLDAWAATALQTIGQAVAGRLRNSYVTTFNAAALLVIKPEFQA